MDCWTGVEDLFLKLMVNYRNIQDIITCRVCDKLFVNNVNTITIPNVQIVWDNFKSLENELIEMFNRENMNRFCESCEKPIATTKLKLGQYLWIHTEEAFNVRTYDHAIDLENLKINLNDIPATLRL
ncbi:hypothetical protein TKK_0000199 [Trichogramma kaykai]